MANLDYDGLVYLSYFELVKYEYTFEGVHMLRNSAT